MKPDLCTLYFTLFCLTKKIKGREIRVVGGGIFKHLCKMVPRWLSSSSLVSSGAPCYTLI